MPNRRFIQITIMLAVSASLILFLLHFTSIPTLKRPNEFKIETFTEFKFEYKEFGDALDAYAKIVSWENSEQMRFIILAMTDNSFIDVAMNLYLSSFKRFNITNFLFVGAGKNACKKLHRQSIQCFDFWDDPDSNQSNNYGSKEFIRKMNIRTEMILQALRLNYSVLHTDLDVIFLKNPMPEIEGLLKTKDMVILWDYESYNAGFLAIKATWLCIKVYNIIQMLTNHSSELDDQRALNSALGKILTEGIKIVTLARSSYKSGKDYYEHDNNNFPSANFTDNCPQCIVIHNNWIVSKEAKIYRFKETNMWYLDDDRYYSDENRKYLLYYNPVINKPHKEFNVRVAEISALKNGFKMAEILNRTLIIPRFHCNKKKECPLNSWFQVKSFHDTFAPNYRESSFLLSDFVPHSISLKPSKNCLSGNDQQSLIPRTYSPTCNKQEVNPEYECIPFRPIPILLLTKENEFLQNHTLNKFPNSQIVDLRNNNSVLFESKIKELFAHCQDQVLVLSSLLRVTIAFDEKEKEKLFQQKILKGFKNGRYDQY